MASVLLDVALVIFRTADGLHAARDQCPHRGAPLSMGFVEGDQIICPYHGLHFNGDGRCTLIPAQPNVTPSDRFALLTFPATERYGLVWTTLNGLEKPDLPPFPEWDDKRFFSLANPPVDIRTSAGRQLEGFIDVAHLAWIHNLSFAERSNQIVPVYKTRPTEFGFQSEYVSSVGNVLEKDRGTIPPGFEWRRVFDVFPPFIAILTVDFPEGAVLRILNAATPVSARHTRMFVPVTRDFAIDGTVEDVLAFNAQVFAEDQAVVEAQRPMDLPLDFENEAHFAADRASITYRKMLKEIGLSLKARTVLPT